MSAVRPDRAPLGAERDPDSLWHATAPSRAWAPLQGTVHADVIVVGGGYVGLCAALKLAEAGRSVVLLEARQPGWGASGRNCAHVIPAWGTRTPAEVEKRFGEVGRGMNRRIAASSRALERLVASHKIDCGLRLDGQANLAATPRTIALLPELIAQWRNAGSEISYLDRQGAQSIANSNRYRAGYLHRAGGTVQPLALAQGLAEACERTGVEIHGDTPALEMIQSRDDWLIRTPSGEARASRVILATNAYSSLLWPRLAALGYSIPIAMLASAPLTPEQRALLPAGLPFSDLDDPSLFSGLIAHDRYVMSALPPLGRSTIARLGSNARRKFERVFPQTAPPVWQHAWHGRVMMTPSKLPVIVRPASGLLAGLGCNGFGICGGTMLGAEMARIMLDTRADPPVFPVSPMANAPFWRSFPFLFRNLLTPALRASSRRN